jgi:hypothetical protein
MSGYAIVSRAISRADDPKNEGNGYTLSLHMHSGRVVHGAVLELEEHMLVLEVWERKLYGGHPRAGEPPLQTDRIVMIDPAQVEQVEVCW